MGRVLWTLRRTGLYGMISLVFLLISGISLGTIFRGALPGSAFNWFYCYIFWSVPFLIIMLICSIIYANNYGVDDSPALMVAKFIFEDIISPVWGIIQLPVGFIIGLTGREVEWGGIIFDFLWTVFLILINLYGISAFSM